MPLELLLVIARKRKSLLFRPAYRHNTFLVKGLILYTAYHLHGTLQGTFIYTNTCIPHWTSGSVFW